MSKEQKHPSVRANASAGDPSPVISVTNLRKTFNKPRVSELLVLDHMNFDIYPGEVVALLGRSGSGKSTLLRIIAGLIPPTSGQVVFCGKPIHEPIPGLTMVFQNFALMPWLTVLENVELGLEAQGVPREERRTRALAAIDVVGLDGFESAYPKELSGGMAQRAGLARALVVDPEVLLMDEPFSALDVLTAENLRSDLVNIWQSKKTNIKSVIIVTHNIEEAVILADRILVFAHDPGYVRSELAVDVPRPRDPESSEFRQLVDDVYGLMTTSLVKTKERDRFDTIDHFYRLPKVTISEMMGFLETVAAHSESGRVDLPQLAEACLLEIDDMFPITEMLEMMQLAMVSEGDISLTKTGSDLVKADMLHRKQLFAGHLLAHVPLAQFIRQTLDQREAHVANEEHFLDILKQHLSAKVAEDVLTTVIDWGRYAEIFSYDYNAGVLSLENPT